MKTAILSLFAAGLFALVSGAAERHAEPNTLQTILNQAAPGDDIVLSPGVYYGPFVLDQLGTKEMPITIRADRTARGRVVLTCADRELRENRVKWSCEDETLRLYSVPFDHNPVRVLYSGSDLMPYSTLEGLRNFTLLEGCPGPRHGFFFDPGAKKLYVRLHASKYGPSDPNLHLMAAAPVTAPGYNGEKIAKPEHACLTVRPKGEGNIRIDGITFETPGAAAVLTFASDVTLSNAWFDGCRFGIFGGGPNDALPARVTLEHCFYHNRPCFEDVADLIAEYRDTPVMKKYSIFWWHRKGSYGDREVMKNYETGIAGGIGRNWIIRNNLISDAFEGLSTWGNSWSNGLVVEDNLFENVIDNALETENHASDMTIRHNLFRNCFEPISWQPLDGTPWPGPVRVYDNLFVTTPEFRAIWPWPPSVFKIGASDRNWTKPHMIAPKDGSGPVSKASVTVPGEGFLVYNNTIFFEHGYFMSTPMPIERELVNFHFFDNICVVAGFHRIPEYRAPRIGFDHNLVFFSAGTNPQAEFLAGPGGKVLKDLAELKLGPDFGPAPQSPAAENGIASPRAAARPYVGAVTPGGTWNLPPVGPDEAGQE